jgi:hypothetical protein
MTPKPPKPLWNVWLQDLTPSILTYWCNLICFFTYYLGLLFNQPTKFSPKLRDECCHP